jgi:hypothetical protein
LGECAGAALVIDLDSLIKKTLAKITEQKMAEEDSE